MRNVQKAAFLHSLWLGGYGGNELKSVVRNCIGGLVDGVAGKLVRLVNALDVAYLG
ncbi:hypothetical protein NHF46_03955 [Arthrobacter alpinus]|nr:hypothetical protein [Arthrobacter alpinus]